MVFISRTRRVGLVGGSSRRLALGTWVGRLCANSLQILRAYARQCKTAAYGICICMEYRSTWGVWAGIVRWGTGPLTALGNDGQNSPHLILISE